MNNPFNIPSDILEAATQMIADVKKYQPEWDYEHVLDWAMDGIDEQFELNHHDSRLVRQHFSA